MVKETKESSTLNVAFPIRKLRTVPAFHSPTNIRIGFFLTRTISKKKKKLAAAAIEIIAVISW
jgi:hypothetical protein